MTSSLWLNYYLSLVFQGLEIFLLVVVSFVIFRAKFQKKELSPKIFIYLFLGFLFFWLIFASCKTYLTYQFWKKDPLSQFLLPPYQPWSYFLRYSFYHYFLEIIFAFFSSWFLALIISLIFFWKRLYHLLKPIFWLSFLSGFLFAWPSNLYFFVSFWLVFLIFVLIVNLFFHQKEVSFEYFIFVLAYILTFLGLYFFSAFLAVLQI